MREPLVNGAVVHPAEFRFRRWLNWFPLGLAYAFLYMGRYNLTVAKGELGALMSKTDFGDIFGIGTFVYGCAFVVNGPLTDKIGGKRAMLIALAGACLANAGMGLYIRAMLVAGVAAETVKPVMGVLYAVNMYFQSFGAVAIVKVNSSWFHVRERGGFSGIFGTMIASGIFFAFDVNSRILGAVKPSDPAAVAPVWAVFFAPAALLLAMLVLEVFLLQDRPSQAGHDNIETGEASLGHDEDSISIWVVFRRILTHPVVLTVALIEFCTGVLRQGVMQWYFVYAGEQLKTATDKGGWQFTYEWWGLIQFVAGVLGANLAGWVSDKVFHSRRAPAAGLLYATLTAGVALMTFFLTNSWVLCSLSFVNILAVIGIHGLLSGTATMDFGGRRGTATAVGIIDGFVYLGTGFQSITLGRITEMEGGWSWWPPFLFPFAVIGFVLLRRIWNAMPSGRKTSH
jgi:OPA family glycerol-3-phosphate transporter-like MFS transporter